MLDPERVLAVTGHSVGGICPFGLLSPLPVYSLRRFEKVVPAAGSGNAALKIATERLVELTSAIWVDVPVIGDWTMSLHLYLEIMRSLGSNEMDPPSGLGHKVEGLVRITER